MTSDLTAEISCALSQFWHDGNSLSGELLARSSDGKLSVFQSTNDKGHLFYRGLKRGEMSGLPLVLVCEKEYQQIERKTSQDRDRKAFDDVVLGTFYSVWENNFFKHDWRAIGVVLDAAKPLWQNGKSHALLSTIASKRPRVGTLISDRFADDYFAVCKSTDPMTQMRITAKEGEWKAAGRTALPAYFSAFGVENAEVFFQKQVKQAEKEAERNGRRSLSPTETASKQILDDAVQEFAPEIWESFGNRRPSYSVAETEALLGQFKKALPYRTSQVFLSASVFESDLASALATFVHEHTHIYGYDGGREFTDTLTWLIASVIRNRSSLDRFEKSWNQAIRKVKTERNAKKTRQSNGQEIDIASLSEQEMRRVLQLLPPVQVRRLVERLDEEKQQ